MPGSFCPGKLMLSPCHFPRYRLVLDLKSADYSVTADLCCIQREAQAYCSSAFVVLSGDAGLLSLLRLSKEKLCLRT